MVKTRNRRHTCTNPACVELQDAFKKAGVKIKSEAAESGNKSIEMLAKRLLRTMNDALYVFERLVETTIKDEEMISKRLKDLHQELRMCEYGFHWDDHQSAVDNLVRIYKQGAIEMQWGRKYLHRLKESVRSGDGELTLKVAREILDYPELPIPEDSKEAAVSDLQLKHPQDISVIREMDARARLRQMYYKYRLNELGFPWYEDISAVDNAILLVREGAYRLVNRWCYLMELGFAVKSGDTDAIVAKAKEVFDLAPIVIISPELYDAYCHVLGELKEDYDEMHKGVIGG